jgi:hypothetical protein
MAGLLDLKLQVLGNDAPSLFSAECDFGLASAFAQSIQPFSLFG